jgi:hypothetical protein
MSWVQTNIHGLKKVHRVQKTFMRFDTICSWVQKHTFKDFKKVHIPQIYVHEF